MSTPQVHDFGSVEDRGDAFEFVIESTGAGTCVLVAVVQTERGPRRTEIAGVPSSVWTVVATTVVKELSTEMGEEERENRPPSFRSGLNRLSPLVGRELGVLLIALMEEGAANRVDALLHAWRELAREERWWLYSKAAAPGQQRGAGWRRGLFHALSETSDTRSAPTIEAQKKSSGNIRKEQLEKPNPRATCRCGIPKVRARNQLRARRPESQPKARAAKIKARKNLVRMTLR